MLTAIEPKQAAKYASAHPYAAGAFAAGTAIACAPAVVTAPFLAVAGFGAGGIGASAYYSSVFLVSFLPAWLFALGNLLELG